MRMQNNPFSTDTDEGFLTAAEASVRYHVSNWTIIKAARRANIPTKYCRKRWRRLYAGGPQLAEAIERYEKNEAKPKKNHAEIMNQALDNLMHAMRPLPLKQTKYTVININTN